MRLAGSALRAGYRIHSFETLRSTSDEALRQAALGDRGRLWVVAASQSAGRGRQGRSWTSPPGNVYASLLLVDAVTPALAPQLGLVTGVAVAMTVRSFVGRDCSLALKWPNDLLANGAKICGVLVEGSRLPNGSFACILGVGLNRQHHPLAGTPYPVTDLFAVASARPTVDDLVEALSGAVHDMLTEWNAGRGFEKIRHLWLDHALPAGTSLTVSATGGRVEGRFVTIDERGRLVLATDDGHLQIDAGDVFLMSQPLRVAEGTG